MFSCIRFDRNSIFATLTAVLSLTLASAACAGNAAPDPAPTGSETVLYSFGVAGGTSCSTKTNDGADPKGSLTYVAATGLLFGTTSTTTKGNGDGTIFQINPDGTGYMVDNFFAGAKTDGNDPRNNAMTLADTTLYGTTLTGGKNNNGTIFGINDDGSGYSSPPLFNFAKSATGSKGEQPFSCFVAVGGVLYGMTSAGGKHGGVTGDGTIFSFDTSSSIYTRLFSFGGKQGSDPHGQLILDPNGTTFYGMTRSGGKSDVGVVFSFDTTKNKYKVLQNFRCPGNSTPQCIDSVNGATPDHGALVQSGSTLFGLTTFGGTNGNGTLFSINTDGSHFKILHNFGNSTNDGVNPFGSLTLNGTTLYGTTQLGGNKNNGTVFQIDTTGDNYARIYDFQNGTDAKNPIDNVILLNNTLYGMTEKGGQCSDGAIFAIALP